MSHALWAGRPLWSVCHLLGSAVSVATDRKERQPQDPATLPLLLPLPEPTLLSLCARQVGWLPLVDEICLALYRRGLLTPDLEDWAEQLPGRSLPRSFPFVFVGPISSSSGLRAHTPRASSG